MRSAVAIALTVVAAALLLFWHPSATDLRAAADACHDRGLQPVPIFNEFTGGLHGIRCVSTAKE